MISSSVPTPYQQIDANSAYTDLHSLEQLKSNARVDQDKALPEVARQFESIFLAMIIKSMRQASMGDPIFSSSAGETYQGMYDQQIALDLAKGKGIGLAESIMRQLSGKMNSKRKIEDPSAIQSASLKMPELRLPSFQYPQFDKDDNGKPLPEKTVENSDKSSVSTKNSSIKEQTIDFSTPEQFVQSLWPVAEKTANKLGVNPEVLIAQAALETGWGSSVIKNKSHDSHNLFNIKADNRWDGKKIAKNSLEYEKNIAVNKTSYFRAYDNVQQSFDDYANFIQSNPRYHKALKVASDSEQYLREIHKAGYATDPKYADKIIRVMRSENVQNTVKSKRI